MKRAAVSRTCGFGAVKPRAFRREAAPRRPLRLPTQLAGSPHGLELLALQHGNLRAVAGTSSSYNLQSSLGLTHIMCVCIYIYIYSGFRIESGHRVRYCREPSTRGRYAGSSHSQAIASVASQSASQKVQRQGHHPQGSAAAAAPSEKGTTTAYQPPQPAPLPVPRDLRHGCQEAKLGKGRWLATRMGNPGEGLAQGPSSRAMCRLPPLRAVYQCLAGPDYSADGGEQGRTDLSPEHRAEERHRGPQSRGQAAEDCSMEETGGSQMAELPGAAEGGVRRRTTPIPRGHQKSWKRTWWSSRANNKRP